ncbi:hypothetical protein BH24ACI5_BH24ACI5_13870 [soil metagenome]
MLEIGFALLIIAVVLLLAVLLPILSLVRAQQAQRTSAAVQERLTGLEAEVAGLAASLRTGQSTVAGHEPIPTGAVAAPVPPQPQPQSPPPTPSQTPPPVAVAPTMPATDPVRPADIRTPPLRPREDLEQQIGSRWLLYAGVAAVVLGMSYFVKFAFDNGWISEPLRVVSGVLIGLGLVAGGMRFWSRGLALFGQALAGGGVVVLYISIYAALHFYQLLAPAPAFALMAAVTAGAAWLADRQRSQPMAALALLGGFATPLLVGGERGAQVVLFTYIAILISGSAVIARRHRWPLLSAAAYVCTFLLVVAWFFSSYRAALWLRTELFLTLYAVLFGYLLWALLVSRDRSPQAQLAIAALVTAPLAYHVASIVLLNAHPAAWLLYMVLATVAGLAVSQRAQAAWLRVLVLLLVGLPALAWLQDLQYPGWYGPAMATTFVLYGLHLAAQWEASDADAADRHLPLMSAVHTQLNGLLLPLSLYLFLEDRAAQWNPWLVAALAGWNASLAAVSQRSAPRMSLQFMALSATLAAAAIVLAFDGPTVAVGWAAEGVFVGWLATRERSRWLAFGSGVLVALGGVLLVNLLTGSLPVGETPIFNARALAAIIVIALLGWLAWRTRDDDAAEVRGEARNALIILANLLGVLLLSAEIHAYFAQRAVAASFGEAPLTVASAGLAEQLTLSVTWALYAVVLIAVGIRRRYAPARYFAIALFGVTIAKVLINDIAGLDRFYRMLTVLAVGVLLLFASYLYQRRTN